MRLAGLLVLLSLPTLASAAESGPAKPPPHLDLYPFAAPITDGGRLANYVFVNVRLHGAVGNDAATIKRLEPKIRDAMVRAAHQGGFGLAGDLSHVDEARVAAVALAEARRIGGAATFTRAEIRKQTPQQQRTKSAPVAPRK